MKKSIISVVVGFVLVLYPVSSYSQSRPTCTVGCPCGNACISCTETCWIGGGSAQSQTNNENSPETIALLLATACGGLLISLVAIYFVSKASHEAKMEEATKATDSRLKKIDRIQRQLKRDDITMEEIEELSKELDELSEQPY